MKKVALWILCALVTVIVAAMSASCGGGGGGTGGGGGDVTIIGRVLNIATGDSVSANVQAGGHSTNTEPTDGSFTLSVPSGTTSVVVTGSGFSPFTFTFPAVTDPDSPNDVGDLWVGSETVTLTGRVLSSTSGNPVPNATVNFGGKQGTTNSSGVFNIPGVAYSAGHEVVFWGIVGTVQATGFFKIDFNAAPNVAVGGVVDVGDLSITPSGDNTPPPPPGNITGRVLPLGGSAGTIVTLLESGVPVRVVNLDSTGRYAFWITPGSYTITYVKGAQSAPTQNVTLNSTSETINVPDVTLSP